MRDVLRVQSKPWWPAVSRQLWHAAQETPVREIWIPSDRSSSGYRRLGASHWRLLELLAWWQNRHSDHSYWPLQKMAQKLGVGERRTRQLLRDLQTAGLVEVHQGGGRLRGPSAKGRASDVRVTLEKGKPASPFSRPINTEAGFPLSRQSTRKPASPLNTNQHGSRLPPKEVVNGKEDVATDKDPPPPLNGGDEMRIVSPAGSTRDFFDAAAAASGLVGVQDLVDPAPGKAPVADETPPDRAAVEPPRAPTARPAQPPGEPTASCPDCGNVVDVNGRNHRPDCRCRGRGGRVRQCDGCHEWIDQQAPRRWHLIGCPLRPPKPGDVADGAEAAAPRPGPAQRRRGGFTRAGPAAGQPTTAPLFERAGAEA